MIYKICQINEKISYLKEGRLLYIYFMKKFVKLLKFVGVVTFFFVLGRACFYGESSPFAISLVFALGLVFNMGIINTLISGVSIFFANFTIWSGLVVAFAISICLLLKVLKKVIKPKFWLVIYIFGVVIASIPQIFIYANSSMEVLYYCINAVLSLCCFYLYYRLLLAIKFRGFKTAFVLDEKFSMFVVCLAVSIGLNRLDRLNFGLDRVFCGAFLMFFTKLQNPLFSFVVALSAGCGRLAINKSAGYLLIYLLWAIGLTGCRKSKTVTRMGVLLIIDFLANAVLQTVEGFSVMGLISLLVGQTIYLVVPKKVKVKLTEKFEYLAENGTELANFERAELMGRLAVFSTLFNSINRVYKDMVVPTEKLDNSVNALTDEVSQNICKSCVKYNECYKTKGVQKELKEIVNVAILKNGINYINLPSVFNSCISRSAITNEINAQVKKFKGIKSAMIEQNLNKVTIGNQFKSVANALDCFSGAIDGERRASRHLEEDFMNYLAYEFVESKDCRIILDEKGEFKKAIIMVKLGINKDKFLRVAGKYFKHNLIISSNKFAISSGWQIAELKYAPKYSFLYAVETIGAGGSTKNGDSHSCSKVFGGSYLLSIADGKGHGENAHKTSKKTVELIEQFFRAGIDSATIIKSVNQIMSFNSSENFSAMDLCLFDPYSGNADFIKLGTTPTVIKRANTTKTIVSNALPVGACEFINATVESERLVDGDIVVLTSDGVFDAFGDINNFAGYINNLCVSNVDIIAKSVIGEAVRRSGDKILDDLTVEVFKVF